MLEPERENRKETFIIMNKSAAGELTEEIAAVDIVGAEYVAELYCRDRGDFYEARLTLSVPGDVADWQYNAIFDHYDAELFDEAEAVSVKEITEYSNPAWRLGFEFSRDRASDKPDADELEENINKAVEIHKKELADVFAAIAGKEDEYKEVEYNEHESE